MYVCHTASNELWHIMDMHKASKLWFMNNRQSKPDVQLWLQLFAYTYNLDAKQSEWNNGNIQCYFDAIIHKWMNTNGLYIPACPHKYLMCTSTLHWECLWALRRTLPAQLQTGDWSNFFTVQNEFTLELQHLKNWCQVGKHPHRLKQCWYYGWEVSAHMKLKQLGIWLRGDPG